MNTAASLSCGEPAKPQWFVMRAYKREKQAETALGEARLVSFIPKHYVERTYHGVTSKRLVPVIPSLVFVHASHDQIIEFKKRHNFLQFAMWEKSTGTEYIIIPDDQMDSFIKIASRHEDDITYHETGEMNWQQGTPVQIHGGTLDGVKGVLMRIRGKRNRRVVVMLEGIVAVTAEVSPDRIETL